MTKNPQAQEVAWRKKYLPLVLLASILLAAVIFFGVLIMFVHRLSGTDDTVFPLQTAPYSSVFDWVDYRYHNWSGRLFAEAFVYLFSQVPTIFWKIVTLALYGLMGLTLYLYYRLFGNHSDNQRKYIMLTTAMALPFLIDPGVIFHSTFWITGSMNYFWIAAFGIIGFYPLAYLAVKHTTPKWYITLISSLSAIIAASSQEQIGAIMTLASAVFATYIIFTIWKHTKKIPLYPIIFFVIIAFCFSIQALAPGNSIRIEAEIIRWLPDFRAASLLERATYSVRWVLDALINHMGILLLGIWGILITLFTRKTKKDWLDYTFMLILSIAGTLLLIKGFGDIHVLYEFYPSWKPHIPSVLSSFIIIPWIVIVSLTLIAPSILYRQARGYLITLLMLAAVAATIIVTLSPTVYISGLRTLFMPSITLALTFFLLLSTLLNTYVKSRLIIMGSVLTIAAVNYFLVLFAFLR